MKRERKARDRKASERGDVKEALVVSPTHDSGLVPVAATDLVVGEAIHKPVDAPSPEIALSTPIVSVAKPGSNPLVISDRSKVERKGAQPNRSSKRPNGQKGFWIALAAIVALIVGGPPIFLIFQALAYPFVVVLCCLALWKLYDLFRPSISKANGKD